MRTCATERFDLGILGHQGQRPSRQAAVECQGKELLESAAIARQRRTHALDERLRLG